MWTEFAKLASIDAPFQAVATDWSTSKDTWRITPHPVTIPQTNGIFARQIRIFAQ